MPNHIKNKLEIIGEIEEIEKLFSMFSTHIPSKLNRSFDENIICREIGSDEFSVGWFNEKTGEFTRGHGENQTNQVGLPDGWEFEINQSFDMFPDFNKVIPQPENIFNGDLGEKEEEMCIKEGRPTWYNWNCENWGTKWNSYCHETLSYNIFTFETAWSSVPDIIEGMCLEFPSLKIIYSYADEDTGYNCGIIHYESGEQSSATIPEGESKEAYEIAFKLRPDHKEYYDFVNGKYTYKEDE